MANEEHLAILKQGVDVWNAWRRENPRIIPDLREAHLTGVDLHKADFIMADLTRATLAGVDLYKSVLVMAVLMQANLVAADLSMVDLTRSDLTGANLAQSTLQGTNLRGADLRGSGLRNAEIRGVDLTGANLFRADLTHAIVSVTTFGDLDLSQVYGLDSLKHTAPSTIGIDTLYRSGGKLPASFLRGCGVPDTMIEYARSLVAAERPIDYYSCFISYADEDTALAERLHADLQAAGVRCWYAPHDLEIGEPILSGIDRGIRLHDKLLLILSVASVESAWIEQEVQMALARERTERRRMLFPIRIDDAVSAQTAGWPALVWSQRHVGNFRQWKDHDAYQAAFGRLLRDLKAEQR